MKKIYLMLVVVMLSALIPMQVIADSDYLTATNENGEVKVNITNSVTTQSAEVLLPGIKDSRASVTKELTLKAEAGVIASLRFEISEIPNTGKTTPLNNFNVVVSDAQGNAIYNSATAKEAMRNDSYKEIALGELQANEEKTYKITYSLVDADVDVSDISVTLAAKTNVSATPASTIPASTTPAPKFDFDSLDKKDEFIFDFKDEFTTTESEETGGNTKEIKKICGTDIPAGRFSITGNGKLKVSSSTGTVKSELVISETPVEGKSVKTAVVLLEKDDVLTITPLEGDEDARLKFNKVTTQTVTSTPTPVNPANASKTNPKTGDKNVGVVIGVAALAVLAFVGLELLKRRNKGSN